MNNKGVTLTSLSIYIVAAVVVIGVLAFININFTSQMNDLIQKVRYSNEIIKFYSFFIDDVKNNESIVEYSNNEIKFGNNIKYKIKENSKGVAIYKDSVLLCEELTSAKLLYEHTEGIIQVELEYLVRGNKLNREYKIFKLGKGY